MGQDDTPPDPIPAHRRLGAEHDQVVDWMEFRREVLSALRDMRREQAEANRDQARQLSGIEGRLSEGSASIEKHGIQIAESLSMCGEHNRRLTALENGDRERVAAEREVRAVAKSQASALPKKLRDAFLIGAVGALGPSVVGILIWLVVAWARAGAPGVSIPTPGH